MASLFPSARAVGVPSLPSAAGSSIPACDASSCSRGRAPTMPLTQSAVVLRPEGPVCLCGARGCFERLCCGLWLERDHGRSAEELLQNPLFVARYVVDLSLGLKAALMLLNPARIVIGGGISKAGDALFVPLREELGRQITSWSRARIDVVPAELGDDSVLWGARELARQLTS